MDVSPLMFYKALSDKTRFNMLLLLQSEGSLCVCELEAALEEEQPKISRHLALLRKQDILYAERRGKWIYYDINPEMSPWTEEVLTVTLKNSNEIMEKLKNNLSKMRSKPSCCG